MTSPTFLQSPTPIIGIVGGVGPYAGLDLQQKILEQTIAVRDQDHLPVIAVSWPDAIPDRTAYLLGETADNPAGPLLAQLALLSRMGATVAGIPCNTAHAAPIFDVVEAGVAQFERPLRLVHMIREVAAYLQKAYPDVQRVGVLSTTGTYRAQLYPGILEPLGFGVVAPGREMQETLVHPAIYDPDYGIKANGQATERSRADLLAVIAALQEKGAQAVVLGCTELPLAFPEREVAGLPLVDPTLVLARALIRVADAVRLQDL
ncbi:MAG: amino acid racemase [Chloroflexota bacterium]